VTSTERPLRKDAERNRQRILEAARDLFAEQGLGVTLNDIAHHAGVGVGTVYRRFPDKSVLIDGLFEERLAEMVAMMQAALADSDPWTGVTRFLEGALALQARDRGLKDLILGSPDGLERVARFRAQLMPLGAQLVQRAIDSGQLRPDVAVQDMALIQFMLGSVIDVAHDIAPDLWRRYLDIVIRGLRADPTVAEPLSAPPLPVEGVDEVMSRWRPPRR
jgi:AcrR family transcriptional regulator